MSNGKDDKLKGAGKPEQTGGQSATSQSKKPYATIDLTAKDITPKDKPGSATGQASAPTSASPSAQKPAATATASSAAAATSSGSSSSSSTPNAGSTSKPDATAKAAASPDLASSKTSGPNMPPSSPPPARRGGAGIFQTLVAGAAGGVLTLLGLGALGLLGDTRGSGPLADRIAALETARMSTAPELPTELTERLAAADARAARAEQASGELRARLDEATKSLEARFTAPSPDLEAATTRLAELDKQMQDLVAAARSDPNAGRIPALAQLTTRLGELDTALTTRTTALRSELNQALDKRLAAQTELHEAERTRLTQRAQSIELSVKSVSDETTALRQSVDTLKTDIDARFKATAKLTDVNAAIAPVTEKLAALDENVAGVLKAEADRNLAAGNVLLSIELNNLKRALDRGGRYADELAAVKRIAGDRVNFAMLESAQNIGVPSLTALLSEFRSLAYRMLDAEAEPEDGSVLERMLAGAKSVVRIRRVEHDPDATGTEATIGRMEAALREGRLVDVMAHAEKLPEKARRPADGWLKRIESRYAIDKSLADIEASLKTALVGGNGQKGTN